jgi:hypothetical protein
MNAPRWPLLARSFLAIFFFYFSAVFFAVFSQLIPQLVRRTNRGRRSCP